jgi:hypothetical protein
MTSIQTALRPAVLAAALCAGAASAFAASPYVVGGAAGAITSDSGDWAWDGAYLTGFRAALENPAYFGPAGVVNRSISTTTLGAVNAGTLSGVNMFVGTWISDAQAAPITAAVTSFFLGGGDLFLLQDDSGHDGLGSALGLSTTASTGSVSNGGAPLFSGPFGNAHDVNQFYLTGQLDGAAIAAHNGHIGGTNADGQITSAFWKAGEYAPGAGSLFIIADIDMISTTTACGLPVCGGSYAPLNDNGIYALNTFSFLQSNGGTPPIPEPETYALMLGGLGLMAWLARRRKTA